MEDILLSLMSNTDWNSIIIALIGSGLFCSYFNYTFNKKIESSRQEHEKEMNKLKAKLEANTYITNKQYEREFKICQDIWEELIKCFDVYVDFYNSIQIWNSLNYSDTDTLIDNAKNEIKRVKLCCDKFEYENSKLEPFYDQSVYKSVRNVSEKATSLICCSEKYISSIRKYDAAQNANFIDEARICFNKLIDSKQESSNIIRNYLNSLKLNG